jgi:Fe-S-cluster-containing dehydrogenase component/formate-dependent nitrite reductase membrane component NrfD
VHAGICHTAPPAPAKWAKVIDHTRCIGCHACTTACKSENEVPLGVTRTYVKYVDVGSFPQARRAFQVTRCNQCAASPCTVACPTQAMHRRADGIVDFDKSICIGCKACIAACPYDAIFINPDDHSAEKCNFCAHRIDMGLEPACVIVCPTEAILVGDLTDTTSRVSRLVHREPVSVRRPEKETHPKLFYRGAHQTTLDPLAALRPAGGLFMWSEQINGNGRVVSGSPEVGHGPESAVGSANSSAAAMLAYDVAHQIPWDWRVSLYTLTKGIASGSYLVALLLALLGGLGWESTVWLRTAPILALVFLGITGALLIWDLEHPGRFYMIFTRPHWKSWLVRGGFVIAGFGALLTGHLLSGLSNSGTPRALAWLGAPLAAMTAAYTAYLFAQAKARDLWQNPLLPAHFVVQALLAGSAVLLPVAPGSAGSDMRTLLAGAAALHLLLVLGEVSLTHPTAHARRAAHEMVRGRFRVFFWLGVALVGVAVGTPWIGTLASPIALLGLLAHEHAYVQAGQSVPLS